MPGTSQPWGWVPNLPGELRYTVYPRTLKQQPEHTPEELARVKRFEMGEAGSWTRDPAPKVSYRNTLDFARLVKLDILL